MEHERFMAAALAEARLAAAAGEVPVGCVVVVDGAIVATSHNRREELNDATAHAEILAIREAGRRLSRWRLNQATLYVTLEPCPMCAGALVQARLGCLVYGADDPKSWADRSLLDILQNPLLNHQVAVRSGILAEESSALLREFFRSRRDDVL